MVEWLGMESFIAGSLGSIPGQGTKIPQAALCGQKKIYFFNCLYSSEHILFLFRESIDCIYFKCLFLNYVYNSDLL